MKTIYLIRHSAPFVEIYNYKDYESVSWSDYNRNMILSSEGEEKAKNLCNVEELKNLDEIFSADSFRAIATAKYVAEINNLNIKLDKRINERNLGINTISELPDGFQNDSFKNKDLKFKNGESLNEVDERFSSFLTEILENNHNQIALFIHGIIMMSFLQNNTNFSFDGKNMKLIFKDKVIFDGRMKNPMIFKIDYENNTIVNIEEIGIN